MYNEEYENRGFPFRDFLLKLILIIIFVFLLCWLLPKFIAPTIVNENNTTVDVSALTSQIFADNLERMKEAAITYYTDERLPKNVGDKEKMTLSDMIGKKIITPLVDKNNKPCDVEESYVEITKMDDEYLLKVNLKDSEKEDYILVHLGCYTYCESDVCAKKDTTVNIKGAKPEDNVVVKPTPTPTPNPEPTPTPTPTPEPEPEPGVEYLYEYQRVTGVELSAWSKWAWTKENGANKRVDCNTPKIACAANDYKCLYELDLYSRKEKIGTYQKKYVKEKEEMILAATYTQKTCAKYNYVIINNTTYATTVTTTYTTVTRSGGSGWTKVGSGSYDNPPRDTATTQYVFTGADYSYCSETCSTLPTYYYDTYQYTGGSLSQVTSSTSTPGSTVVSTETNVTASCGQIVEKQVPVYKTVVKSEIATRTEPLYGNVCYQRTRTRTITDPGKTQNKWSTYNDRTLLDNGWYYTGAKKVK